VERALVLVALCGVLIGCGSPLPKRVVFEPPTGPLRCVHDEVAAWAYNSAMAYPRSRAFTAFPFVDAEAATAYQAGVRALGASLGTSETEAPLILEHLRLSVRELASAGGCTVSYGHWTDARGLKYAITCGKLTAEAEAKRAGLEKAVSTNFLPILAAADRMKSSCPKGSSPGFSQSFHPIAVGAAKGELRGQEQETARKADQAETVGVGCDRTRPDACRLGCERGNPEACSTLQDAVKTSDPAAAMKAGERACTLRLEAKNDPNVDTECEHAIRAAKEAGDLKHAGELLDQTCAAAPSTAACRRPALSDTKGPLFTAARARKVAVALDACTGPDCEKADLLTWPSVHYDAAAARRALPWMLEQCEAHHDRCVFGASALVARAAPHYDEASARRAVAELDKGCNGSVKFTMTRSMGAPSLVGQPIGASLVCIVVFYPYAYGPLADPARALAIAEAQVTGTPPMGQFLAACSVNGWCGKPVDLDAARAAYSRACEAFAKKYPSSKRADNRDCRIGDGAEPLPPEMKEKP
jgi:hypothetical protein